MTDYKNLRKICEQNSRISEQVVDDFLLGYAARHQGLEKKMNTQFGWYRDVISRFDKDAVEMLKNRIMRFSGCGMCFVKRNSCCSHPR